MGLRWTGTPWLPLLQPELILRANGAHERTLYVFYLRRAGDFDGRRFTEMFEHQANHRQVRGQARFINEEWPAQWKMAAMRQRSSS